MGDASMPGAVWQPQRSRKAVGVLAGRPLPWTSRELPSVQQGNAGMCHTTDGAGEGYFVRLPGICGLEFQQEAGRSSFIFTGHGDTRMAVEWRTAGSSQSSRSPSFATFLTPLPAYRTPWLEPPTKKK